MTKWLPDVPDPLNGLSAVTDVKYDPAGCLLLKVVQSVLDKYPLVEPLAWLIEIAGVAPPVEAIGAVPVTLVTVPTLVEPPRDTGVPLIVIDEFCSFPLAIEPANIVLVTDPVSPVVTNVPAVAGRVIDVLPATAGAVIVTLPEVDPDNCTLGETSPFLTMNSFAISFPYPRVNYTTIAVLVIFIVEDVAEDIVTNNLTFPPLTSTTNETALVEPLISVVE